MASVHSSVGLTQRAAFGGKGLSSAKKAVRAVRPAARAQPTAEVKEIFMPALSSTMTEGKIVSWLKGEGESISKGESVVRRCRLTLSLTPCC